MGKIEIDHTGSGGGITLSSDGTSLLLGGTAIGGGGADLYAANESSPAAQPSATGTNAIAIGDSTTSSGTSSVAIGFGADASNTHNIAIGYNSEASTGTYNFAFGSGATANASYYATAIGQTAGGLGSQAGANGSFAAAGGVTATGNNAIAIGSSYASGTSSFAAAIGNRTSTYGAQGANSVAMGYQAKATGDDSIAIGEASRSFGNFRPLAVGYNAYASQSYSTAIGPYTQATNTNCLAIGYTAYATGYGAIAVGWATSDAARSIAIGERSHTNGIAGAIVFSNGTNQSGNVGDSQAGIYILKGMTTDATPLVLTTNGTTAGSDDQLILVNNSAYSFHGTIVARQQSSQGTACAAWKIEGLIRREGSAGTTTLVNSATTVLDNTPSWGMALSADTTNGCLKVQVTGAASTNIKWNGAIHTSETYYT